MTLLSHRSGGPRTPEGRQAASRNALKTGAYAKTLLPGDDREAYEALENRLLADYPSADIVSETLVRNLAGIIWKMTRLQRVEHAVIADALSRPVNELENPAVELDLPRARAVVNLALRFPSAELPALYQAYEMAARLADKDKVTAKDLAALQDNHPLLWAFFQSEYAEQGYLGGPSEWMDAHDGNQPFRQRVAQKFLEQYDALPLLMVQEPKIRQYISVLQERRLLKLLKIPQMQRAHDDLERAFCRTLAELRKHQKWLSELSVVDVTPENLVHDAKHPDAQQEALSGSS
jgi:hypothetical protein